MVEIHFKGYRTDRHRHLDGRDRPITNDGVAPEAASLGPEAPALFLRNLYQRRPQLDTFHRKAEDRTKGELEGCFRSGKALRRGQPDDQAVPPPLVDRDALALENLLQPAQCSDRPVSLEPQIAAGIANVLMPLEQRTVENREERVGAKAAGFLFRNGKGSDSRAPCPATPSSTRLAGVRGVPGAGDWYRTVPVGHPGPALRSTIRSSATPSRRRLGTADAAVGHALRLRRQRSGMRGRVSDSGGGSNGHLDDMAQHRRPLQVIAKIVAEPAELGRRDQRSHAPGRTPSRDR